MKKLIFMFMLNTGLLTSGMAQNVEWPRYTKTPTGYLMVLRQDDDVFKEIEKMVTAEQIRLGQMCYSSNDSY